MLFESHRGVLVPRPRTTGASRRLQIRVVTLLGAFGILAFILSIVSPNDDLLQQEVGGTRPPYASVVKSLRVVPRACTNRLAAAVLSAPAVKVLPSRIVGIELGREPSRIATVPVTPGYVHSPPL